MSLERFPDSLYREMRLRAFFDEIDEKITIDDMVAGMRDTFGDRTPSVEASIHARIRSTR